MRIVEYDDVGRMLSVVNYPTSDKTVVELSLYKDRLFLAPGYSLNWDEDYVLNGDIAKRPEMPTKLLGNVLVGVPNGANISIGEKTYIADGSGRIELVFSFPGAYTIKVSKWPFVEKEFFYENIS